MPPAVAGGIVVGLVPLRWDCSVGNHQLEADCFLGTVIGGGLDGDGAGAVQVQGAAVKGGGPGIAAAPG